MATLPQLVEEDVQCLDDVLQELLEKTDARTALLIDKGGFLITGRGDRGQFDLTTIAALASGAYLANQTIANLVQEPSFNTVYQQGENHSLLVLSVDEHCLLVVIFIARISVGAVKYFAHPAARQIAAQMTVARQRDPNAGLDLSVLNVADTAGLFKRKG
jgi:predicted regulator of Ras-like GTPase activity (Roadblock/LC7/MglB family)